MLRMHIATEKALLSAHCLLTAVVFSGNSCELTIATARAHCSP